MTSPTAAKFVYAMVANKPPKAEGNAVAVNAEPPAVALNANTPVDAV